MSEREELLPCPFCGGTDLKIGAISRLMNRAAVVCNDCEIIGPEVSFGDFDSSEKTNKKAIKAWNRRQPAAPVQVSEAMVERARKAHILLLRDRNTFDTPIGKAQVHDFRDAMQAALEAALQAGVPSGWTLISEEMLEFLRGAGTFKGCSFGETPMGERGAFWWRKYLPVAQAPGEGV